MKKVDTPSAASGLAMRTELAKQAEVAAMKGVKPSDKERGATSHPSHKGRGYAILCPKN